MIRYDERYLSVMIPKKIYVISKKKESMLPDLMKNLSVRNYCQKRHLKIYKERWFEIYLTTKSEKGDFLWVGTEFNRSSYVLVCEKPLIELDQMIKKIFEYIDDPS